MADGTNKTLFRMACLSSIYNITALAFLSQTSLAPMNTNKLSHPYIKKTIAYLKLLLVSVGCASIIGSCSLSNSLVKTDRDDSGNPRRLLAYANASMPFAAMSELCYDRGSEVQSERGQLTRHLESTGWSKVTDEDCQPTQVAKDLGLYYEVWKNSTYQPNIVAIAVRGTEFSDAQDWKSNLWWITRFVWSEKNQYRRAPDPQEIGRVIKKYKGQNVKFITTGHSLGGGLAQCLLYAFPEEVEQCYAFDPSAVTAYYDSHGHADADHDRAEYEQSLPLNAFPSHRVLRIYEKGEILAIMRSTMRTIYPIDEKILEIRFNFEDKYGAIGNHGITKLAVELSNAVKQGKGPVMTSHRPWWMKP